MNVTLAAPPGDMDYPTEDLEAVPADTTPAPDHQSLMEQIVGFRETVVKLVGDRDRVLLLAALQARLVRATRRDRARLFAVNLRLQDALDRAAVCEAALRAEVEGYVRHNAELLDERRVWLRQKERLEAYAATQQRLDSAPTGGPKPARGRWRR